MLAKLMKFRSSVFAIAGVEFSVFKQSLIPPNGVLGRAAAARPRRTRGGRNAALEAGKPPDDGCCEERDPKLPDRV